eukprot:1159943-Pelagomonas_calceolata.AAC.8
MRWGGEAKPLCNDEHVTRAQAARKEKDGEVGMPTLWTLCLSIEDIQNCTVSKRQGEAMHSWHEALMSSLSLIASVLEQRSQKHN